MALTTAKELAGFKHNGKSKTATRYGLDGNGTRFYLWVYPTGKKFFYYKTKKGEWVRLNELTNLYGLANARDEYRTLYAQDALNPIEKKELKIKQTLQTYTLNQCYDEFFTQAYKLSGEIGSAEYERAQRRRKNANRYIHKWILQPLGDKLLSELSAQILINAFTSAQNPPSTNIMQKNLSTLGHILRQAKIKGLISDYSFIEQARKELNKDLKDYTYMPKERATLLNDRFCLDEQKTSTLIKRVLDSKAFIQTKLLFAFMMISPQRQSELRLLRVDDIASDKSAIIFNKFNTKTLTPARIPLSRQGRRIIELALKLSGGKYIFSINNKPISESTLNNLIKTLSINFTMHSIRATFGTAIQACDELGNNSIYRKKIADIIMLHTTQSAIDKAYFLEQAKQSELLRVLQYWADLMDSIGLDIEPIISELGLNNI